MKNSKVINNQLKIENNNQEIRPMRIEKNSAIVEGIDIGNKIISKDCYFVNTSLYEVLYKCNEMSIGDNLEPVYLMNRRPFCSKDLYKFIYDYNEIRVNWNANGYRISSFDERFKNIESEADEDECVLCNNQCVIDKRNLGAFYFTKSTGCNFDEGFVFMKEDNKGYVKNILDRVSCRIVRGKKNVF